MRVIRATRICTIELHICLRMQKTRAPVSKINCWYLFSQRFSTIPSKMFFIGMHDTEKTYIGMLLFEIHSNFISLWLGKCEKLLLGQMMGPTFEDLHNLRRIRVVKVRVLTVERKELQYLVSTWAPDSI
jgi:hypothetical protein